MHLNEELEKYLSDQLKKSNYCYTFLLVQEFIKWVLLSKTSQMCSLKSLFRAIQLARYKLNYSMLLSRRHAKILGPWLHIAMDMDIKDHPSTELWRGLWHKEEIL